MINEAPECGENVGTHIAACVEWSGGEQRNALLLLHVGSFITSSLVLSIHWQTGPLGASGSGVNL